MRRIRFIFFTSQRLKVDESFPRNLADEHNIRSQETMKISSVAILAALSIPLADVGAETAPLADVVNVGARPYFLLDKMKPSSVKDKLGMILQSLLFFPRVKLLLVPYYSLHTISEECARTKTTFTKSDFSLGHRGAPLQFPEHTIDGYKAAALMGAGIIECDVTFTKDLELVCKNAFCMC